MLKGLKKWKHYADIAEAAGRAETLDSVAAMELAGQIARYEKRFEAAYAEDKDPAKLAAKSSTNALEQMGKAEKHLADLKGQFFELVGYDRMRLARVRQIEGADKSGDVILEMAALNDPPLSEEAEAEENAER